MDKQLGGHVLRQSARGHTLCVLRQAGTPTVAPAVLHAFATWDVALQAGKESACMVWSLVNSRLIACPLIHAHLLSPQ